MAATRTIKTVTPTASRVDIPMATVVIRRVTVTIITMPTVHLAIHTTARDARIPAATTIQCTIHMATTTNTGTIIITGKTRKIAINSHVFSSSYNYRGGPKWVYPQLWARRNPEQLFDRRF